MSRSGYVDGYDEDNWAAFRWRGAVAQAIRGKRGQSLLRALVDALDAMPVKHLSKNVLRDEDGGYCALGVLGAARGVPVETLDPEDYDAVAGAFGIAAALAREIVFENDEASGWAVETPEQRWLRMRAWAAKQLRA